MEIHRALITRENMERLKSLLDTWKIILVKDLAHLEILEQALNCAQVVATDEIPHDVVTMNSQVCVRDMANSRVNVYTLVFPGSTDVSKGKVSVLAPIGTALLGCRTGDLIDWSVPGGQKRLRVLGVYYQPEAARKTAAAATAHVDRDSYYPAA